MGIRSDVNLGNYLELPTEIGGSRYNVFSFLKDRLGIILEGCNENFLNQAGKEVLLKSVALMLPNHIMSYVKLPDKMCKELNGLMAPFWWG